MDHPPRRKCRRSAGFGKRRFRPNFHRQGSSRGECRTTTVCRIDPSALPSKLSLPENTWKKRPCAIAAVISVSQPCSLFPILTRNGARCSFWPCFCTRMPPAALLFPLGTLREFLLSTGVFTASSFRRFPPLWPTYIQLALADRLFQLQCIPPETVGRLRGICLRGVHPRL